MARRHDREDGARVDAAAASVHRYIADGRIIGARVSLRGGMWTTRAARHPHIRPRSSSDGRVGARIPDRAAQMEEHRRAFNTAWPVEAILAAVLTPPLPIDRSTIGNRRPPRGVNYLGLCGLDVRTALQRGAAALGSTSDGRAGGDGVAHRLAYEDANPGRIAAGGGQESPHASTGRFTSRLTGGGPADSSAARSTGGPGDQIEMPGGRRRRRHGRQS